MMKRVSFHTMVMEDTILVHTLHLLEGIPLQEDTPLMVIHLRATHQLGILLVHILHLVILVHLIQVKFPNYFMICNMVGVCCNVMFRFFNM